MRRRSTAGQVVVESALAMTMFLMAIIGLLDFGRAFFAWQTLSVVAREGARWGIVHGSESGLTKQDAEAQGALWVANQFQTTLPANSTVTFTWPAGNNDPGSSVRVTVKAPYTSVAPILGNTSVQLKGVSEMQIIY